MTASQATAPVTALKTLIDEGGIDPTPYFEIAADTLVARHGDKALDYAAIAVERMQAMGDREGLELWCKVQDAIMRRLPDRALNAKAVVH